MLCGYCNAQPPYSTMRRESEQEGCADLLDVWQKVDVEWKLRLKLCCIDVLAMEAVGYSLRQADHSHRLVGEGPGIIDHEVAAVGALIVHEEHQVPIILTCTVLCVLGTDCAQQHLSQQSCPALDAASPSQTPDCCMLIVCKEPHTFAPPCWSLNALHPMYGFLARVCHTHKARCML